MNFIAEFALIKKEFLTNLRGRKPYFLLIGAFLFYAFLLGTMWPDTSDTVYRVSHEIAGFFQTAINILFLLSNLFIPGMAAASFTSERESGTYDMLKGTLLTPWKFVTAKFIVVLCYIMVILATILPILASCLLGGGVSGTQIIKAFGCILVSCTLTTLLSFYASITSRNSSDAIRRAYSMTFIAMGGLSLLGMLLFWIIYMIIEAFTGMNFSGGRWMEHLIVEWTILTNPWIVLNNIFSPMGSFFRSSFFHPLFTNITASLIVSAFILFLIFRRVSREELIALKKDNKKKKKRKKRKTSAFIRYVLTYSRNAIAQKELYTQLFGRTRSQSILTRLAFVFFFALNFLNVWNSAAPYIMINFQLFLIGIFVTGRAANLVTREIENEEFDLIRSTLITPGQYILGKFQAFVYSSFVLLSFCCLINYLFVFGFSRRHYGTNFYDGDLIQRVIFITIANIEVIAVFCTVLMISMACGVAVKKTSPATILAYTLNFLFFGGSLIFLEMIGVRIRSEELGILSPLVALPIFFEKTMPLDFVLVHFCFVAAIFAISFVFANMWMSEKRWVDS